MTTTKLMMVRMTKTTTPTAKLPPMTNSPNDWITWPAACGPVCPFSSTTRVEATLSASRSKVANNKTVGKTPNSMGRET